MRSHLLLVNKTLSRTWWVPPMGRGKYTATIRCFSTSRNVHLSYAKLQWDWEKGFVNTRGDLQVSPKQASINLISTNSKFIKLVRSITAFLPESWFGGSKTVQTWTCSSIATHVFPFSNWRVGGVQLYCVGEDWVSSYFRNSFRASTENTRCPQRTPRWGGDWAAPLCNYCPMSSKNKLIWLLRSFKSRYC